MGFCVDLDRPIPPGHDYELLEETALGWYTADTAARLAYVSRRWGASTDADTAAAGQLATWILTGLGGRSPELVSKRAGAAQDRVLQRTRDMLAAADGPGGASRAASAEVHLDRGTDGNDVLRADLMVDELSGGSTTLPMSAHTGTATLTGGVFDDGSTNREIANGESYTVRPANGSAIVDLAAEVSFPDLPYGRTLTVARSTGNAQSLLIAEPTDVRASADRGVTRITSLPFQPSVVTTTSTAIAELGAEITDQLDVDVVPGDGLASEWGMVGPDGGPFTPVPVVVRSRLLGPFTETPVESPTIPEGAGVVCDVETLIDEGPGRYTTPPCVLQAAGHYVWVDRIEPEDTPIELGRASIRPWQSAFGVASETTTVPPLPSVDVPPPAAAGTPPGASARLPETGVDDSFTATAILAGVSLLALGAALRLARRLSPSRAAPSAGSVRGRATVRRGSR